MYDTERQIIREAAREAALLCLAVREEMIVGTIEKSGREPVTVADYGSQAVILRKLSEHFPQDGTYAEEKGEDLRKLASDEQRRRVLAAVGRILGQEVTLNEVASWMDFGREQQAGRMWAVDPIDGTKGFLRGDQFAVAIGLIVGGQVVVSALACPMLPFDDATTGVIALATRGIGATLEPLKGGNPRPLYVSTQTSIDTARVVESVERAHTDHSFTAGVLEAAGVGGTPVRLDSQAKYAAVADGRAEIYLRTPTVKGYAERVWDHAAGALIVEEAGGQVTDIDGRALDFSQGEHLSANRGVLATNGAVHKKLLDALAEQSS